MAKIITVASQKGGVGKTTTVVNLAASLALSGRTALLVDLDPQGNASSGVGMPRPPPDDGRSEQSHRGVLSYSIDNKPFDSLIAESKIQNLYVLPSTHDLSNLEAIREIQSHGSSAFRHQLRNAVERFEYVLVDCPPSLGGLPTIALTVSDYVIIPIQCEYYAMEGLSQILPLIKKLQSSTNTKLQILGLLLTMYSPELELAQEVVREIREYFQDSTFDSIIPRDVVLAEAASHGLPAFEYAPASRGAWSYVQLAKEVLEDDRS